MTELKYILVSNNKKASGIFEDLHAQAYENVQTMHKASSPFLFLYSRWMSSRYRCVMGLYITSRMANFLRLSRHVMTNNGLQKRPSCPSIFQTKESTSVKLTQAHVYRVDE